MAPLFGKARVTARVDVPEAAGLTVATRQVAFDDLSDVSAMEAV